MDAWKKKASALLLLPPSTPELTTEMRKVKSLRWCADVPTHLARFPTNPLATNTCVDTDEPGGRCRCATLAYGYASEMAAPISGTTEGSTSKCKAINRRGTAPTCAAKGPRAASLHTRQKHVATKHQLFFFARKRGGKQAVWDVHEHTPRIEWSKLAICCWWGVFSWRRESGSYR